MCIQILSDCDFDLWSRNLQSSSTCTEGRRCMPKLLTCYMSSCFKTLSPPLTNSFSMISLSRKEDDPLDKYQPSIRYLQKLGPEYLDLIFKSARWIFESKPEMAFDVGTLLRLDILGLLIDATSTDIHRRRGRTPS